MTGISGLRDKGAGLMALDDGYLSLCRVRDRRSGRVSSWDQRGRNQDYWVIGPSETRVLADLEGPFLAGDALLFGRASASTRAA